MLSRKFLLSGVAGLALGTSTAALAIPFQVNSSALDVTFTDGGAIGGYSPNSYGPIDLDEGESHHFDFGTAIVPLALGSGTGQLTIDLNPPDTDTAVVETGEFGIFSFIFFTLADVDWGDPVQFGYSYGGLTGGILELDMDDFRGRSVSTVPITGTITNVLNPTQVPEPGSLLLLSSGLLAIGASRRRKIQPRGEPRIQPRYC